MHSTIKYFHISMNRPIMLVATLYSAVCCLVVMEARAQDSLVEDPFAPQQQGEGLKIAPRPMLIKAGTKPKPNGPSALEVKKAEAQAIYDANPEAMDPSAPTGKQKVRASLKKEGKRTQSPLPPLPGAPVPATGADLERAVAEIGQIGQMGQSKNPPGQSGKETKGTATPPSLKNSEPGITRSQPPRSTLPEPRKAPALVKKDLVQSAVSEKIANDKKFSGGPQEDKNALIITRSGNAVRGIQTVTDHPSIQALQMTPAENGRGGTVTSFTLTPTMPVVIMMPAAIENIITGSSLITAEKDASSPNQVVIKTSGNPDKPVPIGLHLRDVQMRLYTFTVLIKPLDLSQENPQTIVVEYKPYSNVDLSNNEELLDILKVTQSVDDVITMIVGDLPNTGDYKVELKNVQYQANLDVTVFPLAISASTRNKFDLRKLKITMFIDGKPVKATGSDNLEGAPQKMVIHRLLTTSKKETIIAGYQIEHIAVVVKAPQLKAEEWESVFFVVADESGYTRTIDFGARMREFRAPMNK